MAMAHQLFGDMMREDERRIEERRRKEEEERREKELDRVKDDEREQIVKIQTNLRKQTRDNQLVLDNFDDAERARYQAKGRVYRIAVRKRKAKAVEEVVITNYNNKRPAQ
jgi:putative IMPACT (imprinted ancient) family translation regulator